MLLLTLFLSVLTFAKSPDSCANDCRIEKKENGLYYVACECSKKAKPWSTRSKEIFFRSRLTNATKEEIHIIEENLCASSEAPAELAKVRPLATRPLCECVSTRAHFQLAVSCRKSAAGSNLCIPSHTDIAKRRRLPTLFDYQSCVVDRLNYRKPSSCEEASCDKTKPVCQKGNEIVNIADPEACCPVFVCRPLP